MGSVGKFYIFPIDQVNEVDQTLELIVHYQGEPDTVFKLKKETYGEIARRVDTSKDLEQRFFDHEIGGVLNSCASLDEQDVGEVQITYHLLEKSCPPEYHDIKKSIVQVYFDEIKQKGFKNFRGHRYFGLAEEIASTDALYIAQQIPEVVRQAREAEGTDHVIGEWQIYHVIDSLVDHLDPDKVDERAAIGKFGTIAISLASGAAIPDFDEVAEVSGLANPAARIFHRVSFRRFFKQEFSPFD